MFTGPALAGWIGATRTDVPKSGLGELIGRGQQAWGHTLTRLWAMLPQQPWQQVPPEGLEDRLRLLDGFSIPTCYPDSYPEGTPGEHFGRPQTAERAGPSSCPCHHPMDSCGAGHPSLRCWSRLGVGPLNNDDAIQSCWRSGCSALTAAAQRAWAAISTCC